MDLLATAVLAAALHGLFGVTLSAADLAHVGASPREASWGTGSWTLAVTGGRWTLRQSRGLYGNAVDRGTVSGEGRFVVRLVDGFPHNEDLGRMSWRESAAGLVFVPVVRARNQDIAQILSARPWRRLRGADPIVIRLSGSSTARSTSACFLLIEQGVLSYCLRTFSGRARTPSFMTGGRSASRCAEGHCGRASGWFSASARTAPARRRRSPGR